MEREQRLYFKERWAKRTPLARGLDNLLLPLLLWVLAYSFFATRTRSLAAAVVPAVCVAGAAVVLALWVRRARFERFVRRHTTQLRRQALLECLLLLPDGELEALLPPTRNGCALVFRQHPAEPVGASALLQRLREAMEKGFDRAEVYATAAFCEEARALAPRLPLSVVLHEPEALLALAEKAALLPDEQIVRAAVAETIAQKQRRRKSLRQNALLPAAAKRYAAAAALLLGAGLLTGYRVYYWAMAGFCAVLAVFCRFFGTAPAEETESL